MWEQYLIVLQIAIFKNYLFIDSYIQAVVIHLLDSTE